MAWEYRGYRIERSSHMYDVWRSDQSYVGQLGTLLKAQAFADAEIVSINRPFFNQKTADRIEDDQRELAGR